MTPFIPTPDPHAAGIGPIPDQAPEIPGPPARHRQPDRRSTGVLIAVVAGAALIVLAVVGAVVFGLWLRATPDEKDARRECRTAVQREFDHRVAASGGKDILVTVSGIDMDESRAVRGGYQVNFTVHYSATAPLVGTIPNSLALTCNAKVAGHKMTTAVVNRA